MKKIFFLITTIVIYFDSHAQYDTYEYEYTPCKIITEKRLSDNRKEIKICNTCKEEGSCTIELQIFKEDFLRNGLSIWYYDSTFHNIKKRSSFILGDEYGLAQEFYPNGNLKLEGVCKTIKYFPKKTEGKFKICRVDLLDTTYLPYEDISGIISKFDQYLYTNSISKKNYVNKYGVTLPVKLPQKFGEWNYFQVTGKLQKKEYYLNGILVKTINY
jgi:antitoxin component YwqK of YwqJK toxin-antitoxin module